MPSVCCVMAQKRHTSEKRERNSPKWRKLDGERPNPNSGKSLSHNLTETSARPSHLLKFLSRRFGISPAR
jgi:hypothetical protein